MRRLPYLIVLLVSMSLLLANVGHAWAPTAPSLTDSQTAGLGGYGAAVNGNLQTASAWDQLSDAYRGGEEAEEGREDAVAAGNTDNTDTWDASIAAFDQGVANAQGAVTNGQAIDAAEDLQEGNDDPEIDYLADDVINTNQAQFDLNMGASDARIDQGESLQDAAEAYDEGEDEDARDSEFAATQSGEEAENLEGQSDELDNDVEDANGALDDAAPTAPAEPTAPVTTTTPPTTTTPELPSQDLADQVEMTPDELATAAYNFDMSPQEYVDYLSGLDEGEDEDEEDGKADEPAPPPVVGAWSYNDPASWIKGYEDYDALAAWLLGDKDADIQERQDELRDKFCKGIGAAFVEDCAIAKMCQSELYDFEDIDGVVVGRTASGELISVMHVEGWRTPAAVFINETTGEVFTDIQRYLYKATWNVNMAKLAAPGAGAITELVGVNVNGFNVLFKENGVVKHRYYEDWYMLNASQSMGFTNANPFLTRSNKYYDELCLVLQTPIDVSLGTGLGTKSYKEICNDIVEHTGDPTLMYRIGTPGTPPPGTSSGF